MGQDTEIEWADMVWNCLRGCSLKSLGCKNCYAMKQAHRFSGPGKPYEGLTRLGPNGPTWTGEVRTVPEKLDEPLRWRKPARIFVNSMSDLFHEDVPDSFIDRVFAVMGVAHWHTFQVLTKRADRMAAYFAETWQVPATPAQRVYDIDIPAQAAYVENRWDRINKACDDIPSKVLGDHCWDEEDSLIGRPAWPRKPYPNVWLGVSVEDQKRADERIPHLLRTPAAVRFLSVEPLLGPIDLTMLGGGMFADSWMDCLRGTRGTRSSWADMRDRRIDWVIVGGESGPGARPMHPQWARDIRDQCQSAGVAFHFKQWGGWMPLPEPFRYSPAIGSGNREYNVALRRFAKSYGASVLIDDRPEGWDRAMIEDGCAITNGEMAIGRVGKKASGRLLDGRTWDEFPQPLTPAPA